jgi:hypothetical protein
MSASERPAAPTAIEFADRVMTAIRLVPAPTPTRTFVAALRARALRDAVASLWVAWHLGTVRSWPVAPRVRARSFALVLAVVSVMASGSLAAAAAVHSVVPQRDDANPVTAPAGSSVDEGPPGNGRSSTVPSRVEDQSPAPSEAPKPSERGTVTTQHATAPTDDAHHVPAGDKTNASDDHRGPDDGHATDDRNGPGGSDDAHDGSDDGAPPAATDDHEGGDRPAETNAPDDHAGTSDGGSGSGETPGSTGEPDSGSADSGG